MERQPRADGAQASSALLSKTRAVARRTGRDLRDLLTLVGELARNTESVYVAAEDEITDEIAEELHGLLRSFRANHPGQELEIVILVAPEEGQGGDPHGHSTRDTG